MKIIPILQQGGLFATYNPLQQNSPSSKTSGQTVVQKSKDDDDNKGLKDKDLLNLLKDIDGLPNDMAALTQNLYEMYVTAVNTGDTSNLASVYLRNLMQLKTNVFNKEEYKKAYDKVEKSGGLNEVAITTNGKLVVQDVKTQKLQFMTIDQIKDSTNDNLKVLTNSELLELRAQSPRLVNNNSILKIVENGIGMEEIAKMIQERVQSLGTDEIQYGGQTVRMQGKLVAGIDILKALSEDERTIFDGSTKLEGLHGWSYLNKTQQRQARAALNWIISSLPANALTLLKVKTGSEKGVENLVLSLLQSRISETRHLQTNFQKTWDDLLGTSKNSKGKGEGKGDDDDSMDDIKFNAASEWLKGYGTINEFTINPGGNNAFKVLANGLPLVNAEGAPLGAGKTLQDITTGGYAGILRIEQATMGGNRIKVPNQVILSDGIVYSIDFPIKPDGTPDLRNDTVRRKQQAEREIKAKGINLQDPNSRMQNIRQINAIYASHGFGQVYNSDGSLSQAQWRRFAVVNATADGRAIGYNNPLDKNNLLTPVTDDYEEDQLIAQYKEMNKDYNFDKNNWGWLEGGYNQFYKGTVWIPVDESYISAQVGTKGTFTKNTGLGLNINDQMIYNRNKATQNISLTNRQPR